MDTLRSRNISSVRTPQRRRLRRLQRQLLRPSLIPSPTHVTTAKRSQPHIHKLLLRSTLSDGRNLNLPQTESGSGIRYETTATSTNSASSTDIVFWSEGDNAFVTENASSTYQNCLAGTVNASGADTNTFTDVSKTFSFSYPSDLSVSGAGGGYTQSWMVNATTSGMILAQVKIPKSYLPGRNFGDATFSVGTSADPSAVRDVPHLQPIGW